MGASHRRNRIHIQNSKTINQRLRSELDSINRKQYKFYHLKLQQPRKPNRNHKRIDLELSSEIGNWAILLESRSFLEEKVICHFF